MVNVIMTELGKLKKQLADKEDNFKLRIWNAVHSLIESSEYTGTSLRTLERFTWPKNGWVSYPEKNGLEIGRVVFNEGFTPENIVRSFSDEARNYEEAFSFTYQEKKRIRNKDRRVRGWSGNGARRSWKGTGCSYEVKKAPNVWNSVKVQC